MIINQLFLFTHNILPSTTYIWKNSYISSKAKAHYNIIFSINDTEKYAKQSFTHRHTHAQTKPNSHTHTHSTQGKGWCVWCTIFQPDNSHSTFSLVFLTLASLYFDRCSRLTHSLASSLALSTISTMFVPYGYAT